jgi:hypothetical protein
MMSGKRGHQKLQNRQKASGSIRVRAAQQPTNKRDFGEKAASVNHYDRWLHVPMCAHGTTTGLRIANAISDEGSDLDTFLRFTRRGLA